MTTEIPTKSNVDNDSYIHLTVEHRRGKKKPKHTFKVVAKNILISAVLMATLGLSSTAALYAEPVKKPTLIYSPDVAYTQVTEMREEAELIARLNTAANFVQKLYDSNMVSPMSLQQLGKRLMDIENELNKGGIVPSVNLVEAVEKTDRVVAGIDFSKEGLAIPEGVAEAYKETQFILTNVKYKLGISERLRIVDRGSVGIDFNLTAKNYNVKVFIDSAANELDFATMKDAKGNTLGAPFICKVTSRTFIPYRIMAESMGAKVDWDNAERQVIAVSEKGNKVVMTIGKSEFVVDGAKKLMDVEPFILRTESRTYIPARYLTEGLGYSIDFGWADGNQVIYIISFTKGQTPEQQAAIKKDIETKISQPAPKPAVSKPVEILNAIPNYTPKPLEVGLEFNGKGYTAAQAVRFAEDFLKVYTNYDGTNLAAMNKWEQDVVSYSTPGNNTAQIKQNIINKGGKAAGIIYVDTKKVEIKGGLFYVHAVIDDRAVNNEIIKAVVTIGSYDQQSTHLAISNARWEVVK